MNLFWRASVSSTAATANLTASMGTRCGLPGTRPVRLRHVRSTNDVARYDALQVKFLRATLTEGDTAVDIGAHCGQYAILMAALCGGTGNVIALSPTPGSQSAISESDVESSD